MGTARTSIIKCLTLFRNASAGKGNREQEQQQQLQIVACHFHTSFFPFLSLFLSLSFSLCHSFSCFCCCTFISLGTWRRKPKRKFPIVAIFNYCFEIDVCLRTRHSCSSCQRTHTLTHTCTLAVAVCVLAAIELGVLWHARRICAQHNWSVC